MPNYQSYPTAKDTPSRKSRKGDRSRIFILNKAANKKLLKARKEAREERLAAEEALLEEQNG